MALTYITKVHVCNGHNQLNNKKRVSKSTFFSKLLLSLFDCSRAIKNLNMCFSQHYNVQTVCSTFRYVTPLRVHKHYMLETKLLTIFRLQFWQFFTMYIHKLLAYLHDQPRASGSLFSETLHAQDILLNLSACCIAYFTCMCVD